MRWRYVSSCAGVNVGRRAMLGDLVTGDVSMVCLVYIVGNKGSLMSESLI